jgi:uncharacterized protein (TIGR02271 family)
VTNPQPSDRLIGLTAIDAEGDKVGKVGQVYLDAATGQPAWVTVRTGLFGSSESFAPLDSATVSSDELRLAVPRQLIKDAPNVADDGQLSEQETGALYQHYAGYLGSGPGMSASQPGERPYDGPGGGYASQAGDNAGRVTDDAMTRSEERIRVGTESVQAGRARLRKYVVTENVTATVPVSHEEVRLEREPITEANRDAALSGPEISESEHEVTLRAERPVVAKEAVPVERVRLGTETVTEDQQVTEQVRKEQIDEPDVDLNLRGEDR